MKFYIGLFPFCIILSWISITSSLPSKTKITPFSESDFPVAVNSTLDLSCSMVESNASVSDLQLKKCVPQTCKTLTPVRQTNTTKYYKQTFTTVKTILISYFCEFKKETNSSSHLVVIVGYEPTLPDTVSCVSLDQSDLKCTWDIPDTTRLNTVKSTWTITYSDGALAYRECPEKSENDYTITCHIPAQNDNLMDMFEPASDYTMNVTVNSSIGEVSRIYHIPVAQIVKLTPPAMTIEPQSKVIYVSLQLPEDFDRNRNYGAVVDYLLTYRPTWSNETKQVMLSNDTEILSTSLQNCVPYTTYIVTMKAKLNSSLIWSEVAEKVVKTKSDVPYHRPNTSQGLYTINNITSKTQGFTLFYKPLPKRFWNAENCVINVRVSDQQNGVVWTGNFSLTNAYLEIPLEITLPRYNATLRYMNDEGPANIASSLEITNEENEMVVIAEETKNGYVISWEMDDANLSLVKVMWCIRRNADTCESDVQWEVFNNPGKSVRLLRVGYDTHKIFGVSVQRKGGSTTGLTYPKCYYLLQNSVDQPKLAFTGRRNNTGQLLVDLVTPYCQYPSRPVLYQVFYQEHTDQKLSCPNDLSKNLTVAATYDRQTIPVSNVDPKISYDVCLGVILANNRTVYSTIQTVTVGLSGTFNSDEDSGMVAGILSSIIVLFVIIVLLLWLKRKCNSLDTDIKMPTIESFESPLLSNEPNPGYKNDLSEEKDIREIADSGTQSLPESVSSDDQGPDGDRDSVSSSGIGSTKCESDVFSPPTTPTDAGKITLVFQTELTKPSRADHTTYAMTVTSGHENQHPGNSTSGDQHISSSCSNPIDSYAKGDWEDNALEELRERLESSGDFSGDYQHVMCSNYSSTCASDSENIDTCPSSPELTRNASQSTICDSEMMDDITNTLSSGNSSSLSTFHYNTNIQIDSSGQNVTNDPPYSFA